MKWYIDESVIPNKGGFISAVLLSDKTSIKLHNSIKNHLKINNYKIKGELKLFEINRDKNGKNQIEWIKRTINTRVSRKHIIIKHFKDVKDIKSLIPHFSQFINYLLRTTNYNIVVDNTGFKFSILDKVQQKKRVVFMDSKNSKGVQIADLALALKTK